FEVEIDVALEVDGAGEKFTRGHHHAPAAGIRAGVNGVRDGLCAIRFPVRHGAELGDDKIAAGKLGRVDPSQNLRFELPFGFRVRGRLLRACDDRRRQQNEDGAKGFSWDHFWAEFSTVSIRAFSVLNGTPSAARIFEFLNSIPCAFRTVIPFGAEMCTFSNTTFDMQLFGMPTIEPAFF